MEFNIFKPPQQNSFLCPQNYGKQFKEAVDGIEESITKWKKRLEAIGKWDSEWEDNLKILKTDIKEENFSQRIILLRIKLMDSETKRMVEDHYLNLWSHPDLTTMLKFDAADVYQKDFSERNIISKEEILTKKKTVPGYAEDAIKVEGEDSADGKRKKRKKKNKTKSRQ